MRGLTPAERDFLRSFDNGASDADQSAEQIESMLDRMRKQGRLNTSIHVSGGWRETRYSLSEAGRLALRLWPATMATPGAEER